MASRRLELPGSLGVMAAELRVGMSRDQAIATIRAAYDGRDREWDGPLLYTYGRTHDELSFGKHCDWEFSDFAPADQIAWAELDIDDDDGRDLIVTFGPNGVVSGIRLESTSTWEKLRFAALRWIPGR